MSNVVRIENGETNANTSTTALEGAAEFIHTLDNALAEMISSTNSASEDAEGARRNARAASEFAKLYTSKNYRKKESSGIGDSFDVDSGNSNMNGHSNNADKLSTEILRNDHEHSSGGADDSNVTIESLLHIQNDNDNGDECDWKGNCRVEEVRKCAKTGDVLEEKHSHVQYQNRTFKVDEKKDYFMKEVAPISENKLEEKNDASQCQDGIVKMNQCHEKERKTEYLISENGSKGKYSDDLSEQNTLKTAEYNEGGRGLEKGGSNLKSENGFESRCGDHIYSPVVIRPLVDLSPLAVETLTPKITPISLTNILCQDRNETWATSDVEYAEIVCNGNDQQQENRSSHTLLTSISSQQNSLSSFPNKQCEGADTNINLRKSINGQKEESWRGEQESMRRPHPPPLPVKSLLSKELLKFSTGHFSSAEIGQSHAEDVLSLSLDLERMKERLKTETESNAKTLSDFNKEKKKTSRLTAEIRKNNNELEELKVDLSQANYRVKAADEDAEQALGIAQSGASKQQEIEELLNNALNEIEQLRLSCHNTHDHNAHNDEEKSTHGTRLPVITEEVVVLKHHEGQSDRCTAIIASPSLEKETSRAIISVGRGLLRRSTPSNVVESAPESPQDVSPNTTGSHWIDLKRKTADKRRRLRERLNDSSTREHSTTGREIVCYSSKPAQSDKSGSANITCRNVASIVRKSGKALNLDGRWFSIRRGRRRDEDALELEPMTTQYCKSVEVLVSNHQKQVKELVAYNAYLEGEIAKS